MKSILTQIINKIITENKISLKGIKLKIVSPTSIKHLVDLSKKNRKTRKIFQHVEQRIKERADPFYKNIEEFREVGGYSLIRDVEGELILSNILETVGEKVRTSVKPGGVDFVWECNFPNIIDLPVD